MRRVICFGNELHGDDGFGPAVCRGLRARGLPAGWEAVEAGTPGLAALALFAGCEAAILVDAAAPAGRPGRLSRPAPDCIVEEAALPGHGAGVGGLLRALDALGETPPVLSILAAEMAALTPFSPGLSPPVARAVEAALDWLDGWLARHG